MIIRMAFRNIFRQKRRSLLTILSMFGGFAMAAIFIGWADGSYNNIIDNFTRYNYGHIQIHKEDYLDRPSLYKTIDNYGDIETILEGTEKIDSWAPRLYSVGLVSVDEKSSGTRIIGIDPESENRTTAFNKKITEGEGFSDAHAYEAVIGQGLAKILKAGVNDSIVIVSQTADGSIANDRYKILKAGVNDSIVIVSQAADGSIANDRYKIVGIIDTGNEVADRSSFYLPLETAQELLVLYGRVHEVAITVKNLHYVLPITEQLGAALGDSDLTVAPWQEFARSFYIAMKADMEGMWISLFIIVLIVSVGVFNTVLMSVLERVREYGVLKAVGTKPGQIIRLVLAEVNIMAVFSILLGIIVGYIVNYLLSTHGVTLTEGFSYGGMEFREMKSEINARSFYIPALTVLLSGFIIGLFPSIKAAHTDPAKSMRFH
jgi:putative ABC transport system permease protein